MARIARETPSEHILVVDTNILWHKDKSFPVSPDFDAFLDSHSSSMPLRLVVPEVVFGELWFQQTTSATKTLEKISEQIKEISAVTQAIHGHKITNAKLKSQVHDKLMKWLKGKGGTIAKTPLGEINWAGVVENAVWRLPPFTLDSKNPEMEKGFRDSLILETLADVAKNSETNNNVVFLCNDYLLRTTAADRLKHRKNCLFFESLPDFESYLKLTQEQLTNKFVRAIQAKARSKFYSADDPTCLYSKEDIRKSIQDEFADELSHPEKVASKGLKTFLSLGGNDWTSMAERWWINSTQFKELVDQREFHWVSRVTVARLFTQEKTTTGLLSSVLQPQQQLLLLGFDISWKSTVKSDGRFHDSKVINMNLAESSFEVPTADELKRWKLNADDEAA